MSSSHPTSPPPVWLGIETGATHTSVLVASGLATNGHRFHVLDRFDLGPANVRLATHQELTSLFSAIRDRMGSRPSAIGGGFAGLRSEDDRRRVRALLEKVWPGIPLVATDDLETAIEAAGAWPDHIDSRVLLLSGTGSCAYGRNSEGKTVKIGGRGHILGDQGSACDIALQALRSIVYQHDVKARFPALGEAVLRSLQFNHPDDLIPWTQEAGKNEIASLAVTVFAEAARGDDLANHIILVAAQKLADMAVRCAHHLGASDEGVQFILTGGTLLKQSLYAEAVTTQLKDRHPQSRIDLLQNESVWGAVTLASGLVPSPAGADGPVGAGVIAVREPEEVVSLASLANSPTEQRNPATMQLDKLPLSEGVALLIRESEIAVAAVHGVSEDLQWLIEETIEAFKKGGRLFYVGAGTSGRLGVLDASECPPTFRVSPEQVQGIMAGGQRAIWSAVEGAEDNAGAGASAVQFRGVRKGDVILGIAASGRTPYVWGALHEAKRLGAVTALLCFNPHLEVKPEHAPDRILRVNAGPEPLTGSTRMKSGTATKIVLNTLTTLAMVHTGKVMSNLMVDLNASNVKLRDRAVRLVRELTGSDAERARAALERSGWKVKEACRVLEGK